MGGRNQAEWVADLFRNRWPEWSGIRTILLSEVIEKYPEDKYGPSCLICGVSKEGKILHVQCSIDPVWIITAYDPTLNPDKWDKDFKRRRRTS